MVVIVKCKKLLILMMLLFFIKGSDYRINFWYMSNDDSINIMNNSDLNDENGLL